MAKNLKLSFYKRKKGKKNLPKWKTLKQKSIFELASDIGIVAEKTRSRKISQEELKGGTFTISNLGGIGGSHFTPIVNKPEVAILGIGRGVAKPVVRDDHKKRRQHHEQNAQPVHADVIRDAQLPDPSDALDELHLGHRAKGGE